MTKPKKAVANLLSSPLHVIVGLDLLATGMILFMHHHYFFWPPWPEWITAVENNAVVGFVGLVTGIGLISWAFNEKKPIELNRLLVSTASAYYALLGTTELMHGLFAPQGVPNMMTAGATELTLLFVTLYMAKISPTKKG